MFVIKDDDTKDPMRQKTLKKKDPKDKRSKTEFPETGI